MTRPHIVVGVDGSDGAAVALRWAVAEAALRDALVVAVYAWQLPYVGDAAGMAGLALDGSALESAASKTLATAVAALDAHDVPIEECVRRGDPSGALLHEAQERGADLLVVGSRGRGGFSGLLLGSVSQQCAHHAPCPVVVVPRPAAA